MDRLLYSIVIVVVFACCSNSPRTERKAIITGNIVADLNSLLPDGSITADIMNGTKTTPRQKELTKKFKAAVKRNDEWFSDYMQKVPEGETAPYHQNMGLTEREYNELVSYMDKIELVSSGEINFKIETKGDIIQFKDCSKFPVIEWIKIDLNKNVVSIGQHELPFSDTITVTSDSNGLKSKWKGYQWVLQQPKDMDLDAFKNMHSLNAMQYKFTIGLLDKTGKTYMSIKGREVSNGEQQVAFDLPIVF